MTVNCILVEIASRRLLVYVQIDFNVGYRQSRALEVKLYISCSMRDSILLSIPDRVA